MTKKEGACSHELGGNVKRLTSLFAALVLVGALAAMSAATASAGTVLCTEEEATTCAPESVVSAGSYLTTASLATKPSDLFVLRSGSTEVLDCGTNYMRAKTTIKNGNPLLGETVNSLHLPTCGSVATSGKCTSADMSDPVAALESTSEGSGIVRFGSGAEPLTVSFKCDQGSGVQVSCTYAATGSVTMDIATGATISGAPMVRTAADGFAVCPANASLTVDNVVDRHSEAVRSVSKATETVLCDNYLSETSYCPNAEVLPAGSFLIGGGLTPDSFKVQVGSSTLLSCDTTVMSFESLEQSGSPLHAVSAFNLHKPSCDAYGYSAEKCSTLALNGPPTTIESTGVETASVTIGSAAQPLVLSFACNFGGGMVVNCTYKASNSVTLGVVEGTAIAKEVPLTASGGGLCIGPAKLSINNLVSGDAVIAPI